MSKYNIGIDPAPDVKEESITWLRGWAKSGEGPLPVSDGSRV